MNNKTANCKDNHNRIVITNILQCFHDDKMKWNVDMMIGRYCGLYWKPSQSTEIPWEKGTIILCNKKCFQQYSILPKLEMPHFWPSLLADLWIVDILKLSVADKWCWKNPTFHCTSTVRHCSLETEFRKKQSFKNWKIVLFWISYQNETERLFFCTPFNICYKTLLFPAFVKSFCVLTV